MGEILASLFLEASTGHLKYAYETGFMYTHQTSSDSRKGRTDPEMQKLMDW